MDALVPLMPPPGWNPYSRKCWTKLQLRFRPPRDGPAVSIRLHDYATQPRCSGPDGNLSVRIREAKQMATRRISNEERAIVDALNALRHRYTYVFTTGGIGPTHSDITADCVAKAFGAPIDIDPRALAILHEWVKTTGAEMNEARLRMTHIPKGASSTRCHGAPGFRKCNRDGAGQTRGRGHAGANAASTIKWRLSLALSRRKQGFESPRERQ